MECRLVKWWHWICFSINGTECLLSGTMKATLITFLLSNKEIGEYNNNAYLRLMNYSRSIRVVAIDNSVTSLHMPIPLEKYLKSVHECLIQITTQPREVFKGFNRFIEMFMAFTGYQITEQSVLQMQFGVLEGILSIVKNISADMVTTFKQEMHNVVPKDTDWANVIIFDVPPLNLKLLFQVWFDGIKDVSVEFLIKMHEEFKSHQALAEQILTDNPIECEIIYNTGIDARYLEGVRK